MIRDLLLVLALAGSATGLILQFSEAIDQCTGFCAQPVEDDDDDAVPEPTMYRVRYPSIIGVRG
jgi:hypothetical protein